MPSIRAAVLAQLARGPQDQKQLLDAIEEIETPKQLANCLYSLRNTGDVIRDDDGRYGLVVTATDRALATAMGVPAERVAHDLAAGVAGHQDDVPAARRRRRSVLSRSASSYVAAQQAIEQLTQYEEAEQLSDVFAQKRTVRAILEKAAADNQSALDEYVASIADPRILGPLRNARDQARAALAALNESAGSK